MSVKNKNVSTTGNVGKLIALANLNSNYQEFLKRAEQAQAERKKFFAAGLFIDREGKALLVKDKQDGELTKVWYKMPGGVADGCFSKEMFLTNLYDQLIKMKYSSKMTDQIMKLEESKKRTAPEHGLILELLEETGFYPTNFGYGCDGYRYNRESFQHDLWQIYFQIHTLISPSSKDIKEGIKIIRKAPTAIALDRDILEMRATCDFRELIEKLGPFPQKKEPKFYF